MATVKKPQDKSRKTFSRLILFIARGIDKPNPMVIQSILSIKNESWSDLKVKILARKEQHAEWTRLLQDAGLDSFVQSDKCKLDELPGKDLREVDVALFPESQVIFIPAAGLEKEVNLGSLLAHKALASENPNFQEIILHETGAKGKEHPIPVMPGLMAAYFYPFLMRASGNGVSFFRYMSQKLHLTIEKNTITQPDPFTAKIHGRGLFSGIQDCLEWNVRTPVREWRTKPQTVFPFIKQSSVFRLAFLVVATLFLVLIPVLSIHSGISGDEPNFQYPQAVKIYNYFATLGKDKSYEQSNVDMNAYGMSFDVVTVFLIRIFHIENIYEFRHFLNGFTGWIAILFAGLLAIRLGGYRAGLLTLLLAFLTPSFMGHVWNNPKDIPFATGYMMGLYFIVRFLQEMPTPRRSTLIYTGLAIAAAISVRVGGLLLIAYLGFFTALYFLFRKGLLHVFDGDNRKLIWKSLGYMLIISLIGYFAGLILWPYGLQNPIKNPIIALSTFTNFSTSLRQNFEGKFIWSDHVPWNYIPQYMLFTIPVLVLLGFVLFIFLMRKMDRQYKYLWSFVLLFAFAFPILYIIYKKSNVYGGWRHALFTFPPLAVMSGLGYEYLLNLSKRKVYLYIVAAMILALSFHPLRFIIKNHPFEYMYYNEIIGGVDKAYGKYETDYYYHSIREGCYWLRKELEPELKAGKKIIVASNFSLSVQYYFRDLKDQVKVVYIRYYDRGESDWDYAIVANSYMNPAQLKSGKFPPKHTIHTIDVDEVPVCAIIKRTSKDDFMGYKAIEAKQYTNARNYFLSALQDNPDNESALMDLSRVYIETNHADSSMPYLSHLLKVYPDYDKGLNLVGIAYLNKNEPDKALSIFERIIKVNPKFAAAYHSLGLIYMQSGNLKMALNYFQTAIQVNSAYKPAYFGYAEALKRLGKPDEARQVLDYASQLP